MGGHGGDPQQGMEHARDMLTNVDYSADPYACAKDAAAVVIITEWDDFRALDMKRLKTVMAEPVIVDLRNIYRPDDMRKLGFKYASIGRV